MFDLEALRRFGANVEDGLNTCVNNEEFYLKMVRKAVADASFDRLEKAVEGKDLDEAFEAAHALKGALGNLAITPILEPVVEMTEHLRGREDMDYGPYLKTILDKKKELEEIVNADA